MELQQGQIPSISFQKQIDNSKRRSGKSKEYLRDLRSDSDVKPMQLLEIFSFIFERIYNFNTSYILSIIQVFRNQEFTFCLLSSRYD